MTDQRIVKPGSFSIHFTPNDPRAKYLFLVPTCGSSSLGEILLLGDTVVPLSWKLELPHAALVPYAFAYTVKGGDSV